MPKSVMRDQVNVMSWNFLELKVSFGRYNGRFKLAFYNTNTGAIITELKILSDQLKASQSSITSKVSGFSDTVCAHTHFRIQKMIFLWHKFETTCMELTFPDDTLVGYHVYTLWTLDEVFDQTVLLKKINHNSSQEIYKLINHASQNLPDTVNGLFKQSSLATTEWKPGKIWPVMTFLVITRKKRINPVQEHHKFRQKSFKRVF